MNKLDKTYLDAYIWAKFDQKLNNIVNIGHSNLIWTN